jgi:hypothetical protein
VIARLQTFAHLATFAAALWILAVVGWGFATGAKDIEAPPIALWLLVAGVVAQLSLRLVNHVVRR